MLEVIPAVDIKAGRCVRLVQGDMATETVYFQDPLEAAAFWAGQGAERLHVVDLDGAVAGRPLNRGVIERIVREMRIPVQIGGGIRTPEDMERYFEAGADRLIVGTAACRDPAIIEGVSRRYPRRIFIGIDARDGFVAVDGWTRLTEVRPSALVASLQKLPVGGVIYTNIRRDGMLCGLDIEGLRDLLGATHLSVIASGGVSTAEDIGALARLNDERLIGVIVGKALYSGTLTLAEAKAAALTS